MSSESECPLSKSESESTFDTMSSEDTAPAVLHPPAWLGGLFDDEKKEFDTAWLKAMSDWPETATQKEKEELYHEMHGQVLEEDHTYAYYPNASSYEKKVKKSGLSHEQYDSLADAFKAIAKKTPKAPLGESSLEMYNRINARKEITKEKCAAKKTKKDVKNGKQKVLTSYFINTDATEELEHDDWYAKKSKFSKKSRIV